MAMTDGKQPTGKPAIRPAATLLLVRNQKGASGVEVLALKRSQQMRFLPGHIAFPGGTLDQGDWELHRQHPTGKVTNQQQQDDAAYAIGALRELAEEIGWMVGAVRDSAGVILLDSELQDGLLNNQFDYAALLERVHARIDWDNIRFVGRWVTPPTMPARFDTRFFVCHVGGKDDTPMRIHEAENEWAAWVSPALMLKEIEAGSAEAVPPTIAMLRAMSAYRDAETCAAELSVPGPTPIP